MKITPLDIRRKEFKRSVRGYSDEEVDIFLDEVADEFERLFQENMELHDRLARMDEQVAGHAQLKDALEKTLISAQLQAEELRANAHKESELILRDAEMKARGIVSDSYGETQKTQQTLVQLKLLEEDFRFKFRSLLEGYLRLLNQAPLASTAGDEPVIAQTPAPKPPTAPPASPGPDAGRPSAVAPPAQAAEAPPAPAPVAPYARPVASENEQTALRTAQGGPGGLSTPPAGLAPSALPAQMAPIAPVAPPMTTAERMPVSPLAAPSAPVAPPAPAPAAAPAVPSAAPAADPMFRPMEAPRSTAARFDDDAPTQESALGASAASAVQTRWVRGRDEVAPEVTQEVDTAETSFAEEPTLTDRPAGEEPLRRFFFGRQLNDVDDTFQSDDARKRDRNRDFEW